MRAIGWCKSPKHFSRGCNMDAFILVTMEASYGHIMDGIDHCCGVGRKHVNRFEYPRNSGENAGSYA